MSRNPSSTSRIFPIAGLIATAVLGSSGCDKNAAGAFERPPAPVVVAAAVSQDVPLYLDQIGKVVAREMVSVQPQVSGRITAIHFKDGADVRAGAPLFTIDPRPYKAQLDAAEATLSQARATLELARVEAERAEGLIATRAISQSEADTRKSAVQVAEAQVQQSEAAVETARLDLEYCSIRSPIEGRTGRRLVDLGNVVAASTGSLLTIQRLDPIYADFTITENDLTSVQQNMARGTLKVEVHLPDDQDEPRSGDLTFLDNAVQGSTGTVTLRATIPNADRRFWPGRFVKVRLVLSTLRGAVLVPATASQTSANGPFVYVVAGDESAQLRPVKLGQRQGEMLVIEDGLKPGERVIVAGQLGVTPGGKVKVEVQPPAAPAGPRSDAAAGAGGSKS